MTQNNTENEKESRTASIAWSEENERIRRAKVVFDEYRNHPSLNNPNRPMRPQEILTEALIALGEKEGLVTDSNSLAQQLLQSVEELKVMISSQYQVLESRIQGLAKDGFITHEQAEKVTEVIDNETRNFALNMASSLKGGKKR